MQLRTIASAGRWRWRRRIAPSHVEGPTRSVRALRSNVLGLCWADCTVHPTRDDHANGRASTVIGYRPSSFWMPASLRGDDCHFGFAAACVACSSASLPSPALPGELRSEVCVFSRYVDRRSAHWTAPGMWQQR